MNNNIEEFQFKRYPNKTLLYCTGYPEEEFVSNYRKQYNLTKSDDDLILNGKNYTFVKKLGFDVISIWDYRKREGGYKLTKNLRVDAWGRIYKDKWYLWDGVFKDKSTIENWEYLDVPRISDLRGVNDILKNFKELELYPVFSLPGLFEKTWQSMGFVQFAKYLNDGNLEFIKYVIDYFFKYLQHLISTLTQYGVKTFLVADDFAYKEREFISKGIFLDLFFSKYKELTKIIHQNNQSIILHSDGYITNLIDVIINMGFDGIQSLEPDAGVNLIELFHKYRNKICFIGNISNTLLAFGTTKQVENSVKLLISNARKTNAYLIISPTQQINSVIKPENIKTMIMTTKNFLK